MIVLHPLVLAGSGKADLRRACDRSGIGSSIDQLSSPEVFVTWKLPSSLTARLPVWNPPSPKPVSASNTRIHLSSPMGTLYPRALHHEMAAMPSKCFPHHSQPSLLDNFWLVKSLRSHVPNHLSYIVEVDVRALGDPSGHSQSTVVSCSRGEALTRSKASGK